MKPLKPRAMARKARSNEAKERCCFLVLSFLPAPARLTRCRSASALRVLLALGKDSVMFMAADEFPLPYEYRFFELDGLQSTLPVDLAQRTIVFLDCGNIDRNPVGAFKREEAHILNIDHHHDNTRFGTVNHVVEDASCTAEIVWDLMRALNVEPTIEIAEALYVGLVTDTGKFMYENTGSDAHVMAAELIGAGIDVHEIYRRLYEGVPQGKLELLARGLSAVERFDGGLLHQIAGHLLGIAVHRRGVDHRPTARAAGALTATEIAVGRRRTAFPGLELIAVDRCAQRAWKTQMSCPSSAAASTRASFAIRPTCPEMTCGSCVRPDISSQDIATVTLRWPG